MEIQFQQQHNGKMSKLKSRNNKKKNKFVGVRQRPSGRWVAEIKDTTQKIRMWLGTFETAEAAARAYDEAACLLRGSNTRTNFVTRVSQNSPLASRIRNLLNSSKKGNEKNPSLILDTTIKTTTSVPPSTSSNSTTNWTCTSSNSITSSPTSSSAGDFSACGKVNDQSQLFDDAYKPDLSHCNHGFDSSSSCQSNNMSWGFANNTGIDHRYFPFAQEMLDLPVNLIMPEAETEFAEFERMKVERQISASLYAMNGVQEYMETVHDANEAIWDLPPLCSLFC